MYNKSQLQGVNPQTSQRSYRDIKQRQNGIQQLINNSNNSSFLQSSVAHTRNNSSSASNISTNNINQSANSNSIHQISNKQQPNTMIPQRREHSLNLQLSKQDAQGMQLQNKIENVAQQSIISSISERNQLLQIIKKNLSTEQINPQAKQLPDTNRIPHMEKQNSHHRINSESDQDFNKENMSFCVNSIQSNQQRSYNYETSFNSKVIQPEKNYFMPLKQQQAKRKITNMSTDFSNHNNSLRNNTNSQNNSGSCNTNLNTNNSIQHLNKKSNGSSRLLTNLLNDSSANDNIIENYIERVFSKDLQSHQSSQQGFESNQRQSKEEDLSFTQFNAYSEQTHPQQSLNQSNFNTEQSIQDQRIQSQIQIQKQIQSQSIYEQALQQKLKLLPGSRENKNTSSFTQIPRPLNKSHEQSGGNSQMSQRTLNKYLFGENTNSNKRKASQNTHHSISYEDSPQRNNVNNIQQTSLTQQNRNSKDNLIKPFTIVQKEKEECGVPASLYESEIHKENKYYYNSQNSSNVNTNQNAHNSNQQAYNTNIHHLESKINDLEQKSQQQEQTLILKVKQIEQMGNQMHEYEKEKKETQQIIEELQKKSINDKKQIQEQQLCIQQMQGVNQKQQIKIKEQTDQIQLLSMQVFEMEQQIYDISSNAKERERISAKEKSDQILQLKQKFENEVMQLNDQHTQLIQLQNVAFKQTEMLQNEKIELSSKLSIYETQIENLTNQINHLKEQQQQQPLIQPAIKNEQILFLEQQLSDSEKELKDYKQKFRYI